MHLVRFFLALACAAGAVAVNAQESFPSRPIRILVGFSPGGSADILARLVGQRLAETLGQPVIVENKPGAGGSIAASTVAKAPADGYTLFLASTSHTINASYYQTLPYDTVTSFAAVAPIAVVPYALVVNTTGTAKNLRAVVDQAKAAPGKLNFGSSGNGTATHLAGEVFKSMAGIQLQHVPYKGPSEQLQDVLAGRIEMTFVPVNAAKAFVESGKLTAVGVTTAKRSSALQAPTFAEAVVAGYDFTPWFGLLAPAGTPRPVLDKLNAQVAAAVNDPGTHAKLVAQGAEPMTLKPGEFDELVRTEVTRFAKVFRDAGISRQ
ncbi:MAG TPA: tripartite tricarboxylate transporter substrate binding protein [Ramlibacter sp.]|nr:tripartite tricarboxylate transporter substrate binding protein [Ramlibacter sp.]